MEFITTNGQKKVKINIAPFREMSLLKTAAMKCIQKTANNDLLNLKEKDTAKALSIICELLISADTSEDFESALFKCLSHCVYNEFHAITPQFFDDVPEAIEDYYEIVYKCVELNLRPFFKSLVTAFKANMGKPENLNSQK